MLNNQLASQTVILKESTRQYFLRPSFKSSLLFASLIICAVLLSTNHFTWGIISVISINAIYFIGKAISEFNQSLDFRDKFEIKMSDIINDLEN